MKKFRSIAVVFLLTALFALSAFAQTSTPTNAQTAKLAVINMFAFEDAKGGITRYINAVNTLDKEFTPVKTELQGLTTKIEALRKEITTLQEAYQKNPNGPVSAQSIQTKVDEHDKLQREAKFKQDDANARYQTRYNTVVGPVMQEILKAMQEFAKQKGYSLIFDAAKLDESGLVLAVGDVSSMDVTKEFITFFNARPATTATNTKP